MKTVLVWLSLAWGGMAAETSLVQPDEILDQYCAAAAGVQQALDGSSMEVEIHAALPHLKKQGRLHALRHISKLGRITYERIAFEGDGTIKNQVIARYLTAEVEAQKDASPALAVTPANYKFKYKGTSTVDDRPAYVFQVTPKKKRVGLFKGDIWIDATTYLRLQESGYWVKSPSIFLKRLAFVRKYEIRDGVLVPRQIASTIDTRVWGQAQLEIDFSNFSVDDAPGAQAQADGQ